MNFTVKLLILTKCLFLVTVNSKSVNSDGKLIGGHEAKPFSHPYMVSLQTRFLWVRVHTCGGAILNQRWVLSAAHCAIESWLIRWLPLDVVAGIHDVNKYGAQAQIVRINDRIPHPLYEGGIGPYDIAVFSTMTPFVFTKYIQPVKLPQHFKMDGMSLNLAGWGALRTTVFIPDLPSRLQEVKVTFIPYDECYEAIEKIKESYEGNPLNKDANICTGPITGGVAACNGDSGGPLIQYVPNSILTPNDPVEDNTEKYNATLYDCNNDQSTEGGDTTPQDRQYVEDFVPFIIGVVSWGVAPCGDKGAPTVYTNVSTYMDFINYHIKEVE